MAIGLLASLVAGQERLLAALADRVVSAAERVPAPAGLIAVTNLETHTARAAAHARLRRP
jgi:hypothetical protein